MLVPVVNGKALREGTKLAAEGAEIIVKHGDEAADIVRHGDDILDSARAGEKAIDGYETAEKIAKNTDNVTDATKGTKPRYGDRRIYDELRQKTPSKKIQKKINEGIEDKIGTPDSALLGKTINGTLQADHIVPMDKITRMDGFEKLTQKQQMGVLNYGENFTGLSEVANKSKGSKSFTEWTTYKKENIEVSPEYRKRMIEKEKELEIKLQKLIDDFNKQNMDK